ncbi:protein prenylyltransferase [Lindgomyces ingoldianus]|uniref:Protein prenylyltransferase n=1 Tax=Lindgomyces ingoldianus TaxID=673940 RepID=A0ACB6QUI8_9PLEO|nr:protein prenylyltransferase [Lindgomyces ingoldianus]KAF2470611.1 protein prenylyltransferase [Lindgomyces ingoldianus]
MASHGVARVSGTNPAIRSEELRQKELEQIAAYNNLVDLVNFKVADRQYTVEVLDLTTRLLNENPEYYTIWNHRRRILLDLLLIPSSDDRPSTTLYRRGEELIHDDLQLTFALLRKFPKCYWIWNHRIWILQKGELSFNSASARKLWLGELQLVGKMLHLDSRNFHAWTYRRFVVAQLERMQASVTDTSLESVHSTQSLTESEFAYTTKMIKTNLSNFSAWHNRSKLIPMLLDERSADSAARRELLGDELALICTAINTDPFDQSIWFYHQFLMSTLSPKCASQNMIVRDLSNQDRQRYYAHEMEYIQDILEDETECKWIYEALLHCASCYLEIEGSTQAFTVLDMRGWLRELKRLDPLRRGRWDDLGRSLDIS